MGLSVLLSYSIAWYIFNVKYKTSTLAPNQWKSYLLVYSGFYIFNRIVRPARLGVAALLSQYFDAAIQYIQDRTQLRRKYCIGILVFMTNVVGTLFVMSCGICMASLASGIPIFPWHNNAHERYKMWCYFCFYWLIVGANIGARLRDSAANNIVNEYSNESNEERKFECKAGCDVEINIELC